VPGLEATVLDLPAVEPVVAERHLEPAFVAGDLDRSCFGRPAGERGDGPATVALFDLMMLVENEGGAAWPAATLSGWLRAAGLTGIKLRRGAGPIAVLRGTAPGP